MSSAAATRATPARSHAGSGSSNQVRSWRSSMRPTRIASLSVSCWLASAIRRTSGPIASRTARTRASLCATGTGARRIFTARKPCATKSAASRCSSSIERSSHRPPLA